MKLINLNTIKPRLQQRLHQKYKFSQQNTFFSALKEIFVDKHSSDTQYNSNPQNQQKQIETDYYQIAKQLDQLQMDQKELVKHLQDIHQEITQQINECYENENLLNLLKKVPSKKLCLFAIEQFVGSVTSPKNEKVTKLFLDAAETNADTEIDQLEVKYYKLYLKKLNSIQNGDQVGFEQANEQLIELSKLGHPQCLHIIAKEIYKTSLNILTGKYKKSKKDMLEQSFMMFQQAAQNGSHQSFFYLGEMAEKVNYIKLYNKFCQDIYKEMSKIENHSQRYFKHQGLNLKIIMKIWFSNPQGDIPGGIDLEYAYECYLIAAANNSPQAFFRLAQLYKNGIRDVIEQDNELQYYYTKKAAELGLVEAMHNLGCIYQEGKLTKENSLKALSWFTHAGAHGFSHSSYNAAQIFLEGSKDGQVKQNYHAALVWLENAQKSGEIDVSTMIKSVMNKIAQMEHIIE